MTTFDTLNWAKSAPFARFSDDGDLHVSDHVSGHRVIMVNVYFIGDERGWYLVDAGLPGTANSIHKAAEDRFGPGARPQAILLTHGHFDHVGALETLAREWDVPVYAHSLEMPYITGRASYAPPDPWVGGMMALTSPMLPRGPVNVGSRAKPLPFDGSVPYLADWRWLATPGHSPGHVSFYRERDGVLIAGDAFVTTRQEYALAVLTQAQHVCGPPRYFTHDWQSASESVRRLAGMNISIAATGHGTPMGGETLRQQLRDLADHFIEREIPRDGRYGGSPVIYDENGPQKIPPAKPVPPKAIVAGGLIAGMLLGRMGRRS
jgi:glyoxylase-like metal-dependent hydrolase (beta-lactamase superfamily II)